MRFNLLFIFLLVGLLPVAVGQPGAAAVKPVSPHVDPTLRFTENAGQWDNAILFRAQLDGGALFIENNCLTFNFYDKKKFRALHHKGLSSDGYKDLNIQGHAYKIHFEGSNPNPQVQKLDKGTDYENFFIGNDRSKWKGEVYNYHQIWLKNLYDGIDYEIITATTGVKYNFHVKPSAGPDKIKLRYEGIDRLKLKDGALYVKLEINEVIEQKPYAYQLINGKVKEVACRYVLKDKVLGFEFPNGYDKNNELVIDPLLVFAAQSGSTADNFGMTATYDPQGNLYAGGTVFSIGYPTTTGAYNSSYTGAVFYGNSDVAITKYNSTGTALIYSTYIGGSSAETVNSLIVDKSNNLCFFGITGSSNFPTSQGAYDNSFNGGTAITYVGNAQRFSNGTDIYVAKFNFSGSALLGSTYIGGSSNDGLNHTNTFSSFFIPAIPPTPGSVMVQEPNYDSLQFNYGDQCRGEIQLDPSDNIYICSSTRSSDFPVANGFDATLGGKQDGILAKFDPTLSSLIYSSFIGGSSVDAAYGLAVKNNLEVYVVGGTCSNNFPGTTGGYQATYQGGSADAYVIRVNAAGSSILNATYFGTSSYDQAYCIQADKYNDVYIYGQSLGNMPVLAAPNATSVFNVPGTHQFISRFNSTLNTLNLSTVFGNFTNATDISPAAFSVDKCNTIYLSGWGGSVLVGSNLMANMPLASATQSQTDGHDFYFMALDSNAVNLLYGSYFGGGTSEEHVDGGTSRFDPMGRIYQSVCAGCGNNDDFPVTPGAWPNTPGNPNHSTNCNNGVIKLDFQINITISTISSNTLSGCAPFTASLSNATPSANTTYTWYNNGTPVSNTSSITMTFTSAGVHTVALVSFNNASCNRKDSAITYITVFPTPTVNFTHTLTPCGNQLTTANLSTGNFGNNPFLWNFGNTATSTLTSPSYTYPANGNYNLSLTVKDLNGCTATLTKPVTVFVFTPAVNNATMCYGAAVTLSASGGTSYTWSPAGNLNDGNSPTPVANPPSTTVYSVVILNTSGGIPCQATLTSQVLVNPTPTTNFNFTVNPCGGGVYFEDLSQADITSWYWRLSPTITSTEQNPYNFYYTGANFSVTLITTNIYGCKDTIAKPILAPVPPLLSVSAPTMVCKGGSVKLSATGGTAYAWTPVETLDFPIIDSPTASPLVDTQYSVVISTSVVLNGIPCSFLLTTSVNVTQLSTSPVSAQANPNFVITGNSTTLIYLGDPGAQVNWLPAGATIPSSGYTVTATPDRPTTYTAVATKGACREDPEVHVDAYSEGCIEKDVFVPNTFTPNGDGQNDLFMVRGLKVSEVYFAVYNRWGEMVFETADKTRGWDGVYKGKPMDVGVFGWYLRVKCFNGEETFRKGNVTLIR